MLIGVIGLGTVGRPLYSTLKYYHKVVYGYDIKNSSNEWKHILKTDIVFLCLPTDKGENGRLDMSVIESTLKRLSEDKYQGLVVLKSTLRVGYFTEAEKKYDKLNIIVNPEWLREKHALADTLNPELFVIGVKVEGNDYNDSVRKLLEACCWIPEEKTLGCQFEPEEAVMIKLTANGLAATKISFANQIKMICEEYNINYQAVMSKIREDPRCAPRYLIPGGAYGGYCIPKDTSELACCIKDSNLFEVVEEVNEKEKKK